MSAAFAIANHHCAPVAVNANMPEGCNVLPATCGLKPLLRGATANRFTGSISTLRLGSAQSGTTSTGSIAWHLKGISSPRYAGLRARERYTPFGSEIVGNTANDNQAGFTGHIKDGATGLNYMQARYYDPVIGRFLSVDPVGFLETGNPGYFNRYSYTMNDPINAIDPDGRRVVFKHPKGLKGVVSRVKTFLAVRKVNAVPTGRKAFKQLKDSSNVHTINVGPTASGNSTTPTGPGGTVQPNGQNGSGAGTTINWDPNDTTGGVDDNGSTTRNPSIGLGHEVGHAADVDNGSQIAPVPLSRDSNGNVVVPQTPEHETGRSMQIDQEMRTDQGETQRSNYVQ